MNGCRRGGEVPIDPLAGEVVDVVERAGIRVVVWAAGFALKFHGYVRASRAAWPHLRKRHGCIVNIVGVGSRTGSAEFTIGGSVNVALLNFTKALKKEDYDDEQNFDLTLATRF